jgi:hypothetical protein
MAIPLPLGLAVTSSWLNERNPNGEEGFSQKAGEEAAPAPFDHGF